MQKELPVTGDYCRDFGIKEDDGDKNYRLARDVRCSTIAFRYPPNGSLYIFLADDTFRTYIFI